MAAKRWPGEVAAGAGPGEGRSFTHSLMGLKDSSTLPAEKLEPNFILKERKAVGEQGAWASGCGMRWVSGREVPGAAAPRPMGWNNMYINMYL